MKLKRILLLATLWLLLLNLSVGAVAEDLSWTAGVDAAMMLIDTDCVKNGPAIDILLMKSQTSLSMDSEAFQLIQSVRDLIAQGSVDAEPMKLLLGLAKDKAGVQTNEQASTEKASQSDQAFAEQTQELDMEVETFVRGVSGLPIYEENAYMWASLNDKVGVEVPADWGNNASGSATTNYSPVNDSGAIHPAAGTLMTGFSASSNTEESIYDAYEKEISKMIVASNVRSFGASVNGHQGKRICYLMTMGANSFDCEVVLLDYGDTLYSIQMLQGDKSRMDYFGVLDHAVDSVWLDVAAADLPRYERPQEIEPEPGPEIEPIVPNPPLPSAYSSEGDLSSFNYKIDGIGYTFPTRISEMHKSALPIDRRGSLPYDLKPDSMDGGLWTEISNTQYFFFANGLFMEMAAVTNMSGIDSRVEDGVLTLLVDMDGDDVSLTLPGDVKVGSPEYAIVEAFPDFAQLSMDGYAGIRGNELIYACNTREDGCNGYVLIANDAPYYSTLSIICEDGVVREICFECLGSTRAKGVFL